MTRRPSWTRRGQLAWSASSFPAGTSPRRSARSRSPSASRGSMSRSASTRTTLPRSMTPAGARSMAGHATRHVVAVGETGLDYDRVFSPIPDQLTNLRRNLRLAADLDRPAILHCRSGAGRRDAQDALLAELTVMGQGRPSIVIHSFSRPGRLCAGHARSRRVDQLLGARLPERGGVVGRGRRDHAARSPPGRDRFAIPGAARRPAIAQRTGLRRDHRALGRRTPRDRRRTRLETRWSVLTIEPSATAQQRVDRAVARSVVCHLALSHREC